MLPDEWSLLIDLVEGQQIRESMGDFSSSQAECDTHIQDFVMDFICLEGRFWGVWRTYKACIYKEKRNYIFKSDIWRWYTPLVLQWLCNLTITLIPDHLSGLNHLKSSLLYWCLKPGYNRTFSYLRCWIGSNIGMCEARFIGVQDRWLPNHSLNKVAHGFCWGTGSAKHFTGWASGIFPFVSTEFYFNFGWNLTGY